MIDPPPFEVQISETRGGSITWGRLSSDLVNLGSQVFESLRPQVFVPIFFGRFAADFCPTPSVCIKNSRPLRGQFFPTTSVCTKNFGRFFPYPSVCYLKVWPRSGPNFFDSSPSNIQNFQGFWLSNTWGPRTPSV